MKIPWFKSQIGLTLVGAALAGAILAGCGSDNAAPDPVASKKADETRQALIDNQPGLTPEQKAIMKSHMGGPPAPNLATEQSSGGRS